MTELNFFRDSARLLIDLWPSFWIIRLALYGCSDLLEKSTTRAFTWIGTAPWERKQYFTS